jgi:PleD family two-component response regulator
VVVVVDDYPDAAESLARLVRKAGHDAMPLSCGDALFSLLEASTVKLIILDLHMPSIDGLGCLKRLRGDDRWRDIPVIIYTADFHHESMQRALGAGAQEYVVKGTLRWDDLRKVIEKHL